MAGKVYVIAGPTASGKTALSIALALEIGGEIVSADSMQVYRGMDIGTAKATSEERSAVPHHMLDVADPGENFSVARYVEEATACCDDIISRSHIPVITGGTGLYIDSLLSGRSFAESGDPALRAALNEEYDRIGGDAMLARLSAIDPMRAEKLAASDRRRIIRALEIYELTGLTITEHDVASRSVPPRYEAVKVVLGFADRSILYDRIDRRVDEMMNSGLLDEVRSLMARGIDPMCTSMQAIGYKESVMYINGLASYEETVALIKQSSRRYAKRQMTWFRRWRGALRIDRSSQADVSADMELLKREGIII